MEVTNHLLNGMILQCGSLGLLVQASRHVQVASGQRYHVQQVLVSSYLKSWCFFFRFNLWVFDVGLHAFRLENQSILELVLGATKPMYAFIDVES